MKVEQMTNAKGRAVANQFIITDNDGYEYLQSYKSIIVKRTKYDANIPVTLDINYWDYSKTTSKYRNQFLGENTAQIKAKIKSGEYKLADLN